MRRAVLISIQPKWCGKIFCGTKNVEFRKSVPKIGLPFKAYVYCTAGKDTLTDIIRDGDDVYGEIYHGKPIFIKFDRDCPAELLSRKKTVVGEFVVDRIEEVTFDFDREVTLYGGQVENGLMSGGLTLGEFLKYKGRGAVYGWHIADYTLYREPKALEDFGMKRPPQSWCYVEERHADDRHPADAEP